MVSSRTSEIETPRPRYDRRPPTCTDGSPTRLNCRLPITIALGREARWIILVSFLYLGLALSTTFALHPYFGQTWDVVTFVNAGKTAFSTEWPGLYAQSRAERYWPFAYPPAHAFAVAPFVALGHLTADWVMVRLPPLLFDLGLGLLLYLIVQQKTGARDLARLTLAVWLLNPVTWYDSVVQGHFEAEWLFFVVLAYWLAERRRGWLWPTLSLAAAFLFKQNAVLFALPFWASLFFQNREEPWFHRAARVVASVALFGLPIALASWPFLLYSNDYWFLIVQYVAEVPLQTQSWLVALAAMDPDHALLGASSAVVFCSAVLIALLAARRGNGFWPTATLIVLAFFLLSKKVVGYYYVMLSPFALITLVPMRRFRLLTWIVGGSAFISLSPYFASWTQPAHGWVYALLGTANSIGWLALLIWLWRQTPSAAIEGQNARTLVFVSMALFLCASAAALVQPLVNNPTSPIRAPLVPNGLEPNVTLATLVFMLLVALAIGAAARGSQTIGHKQRIPASALAFIAGMTSLYFLTFTLTKESTAALELVLRSLGL